MAKKTMDNGITMTTTSTFGSDYDAETKIKEKEPFNCLRKERIIVRHVPKTTGIVTDKKHILYGGMAENAIRSFVVPMLGNGYVNFMTTEEQECLENVMGLEKGALNPQKRDANFWSEANNNGLNRVFLNRQDNFLDLSVPEDYIKYKILLANKNIIAPSQRVLQEHPKPTYQFVIIQEGAEANTVSAKLSDKKTAYIELGKIQDDVDRMRVVLSTLQKKPVAPTSKVGYLQSVLMEFVDTDTKKFLSIVKDQYFDTMVTLQKAVDRGIVVKRGTFYYDKETNSPLCENGEDPTLRNACKYLHSPKNDSVKFSLEKKIAES